MSMPPHLRRTAPRRSGGRTADVTARVFDAALQLMTTGGFARVSFAAVAERAAVNRSTIYRRWRTPAALVLEAIAARAAVSIAIANRGAFHADLAATLRDLAAFLASPLGRAALSAATQIEREEPVEQLLRSLWAQRAAAVDVMFERAIARGELPASADRELILAAAAGAIYFRTIVTGQPITPAWIRKLVAMLASSGGAIAAD
jgi:AcrR family transcriptional regulator